MTINSHEVISVVLAKIMRIQNM